MKKHLEGTQFCWERMSDSSILVTDPEGQQYTVQDAAAVGHSWPFDLAIKEIRLPAHAGSSEAIAHWYRTLFGVSASPRLGKCTRAAEQDWILTQCWWGGFVLCRDAVPSEALQGGCLLIAS